MFRNINGNTQEDEFSTFSIANQIIDLVSLGQLDAIRSVISKEIDLNVQDSNGKCAVIMAAERNDLEMLTVLVSEGHAKLNIEDNYKHSPLWWAKKHSNQAMVDYIEQHLANDVKQKL